MAESVERGFYEGVMAVNVRLNIFGGVWGGVGCVGLRDGDGGWGWGMGMSCW